MTHFDERGTSLLLSLAILAALSIMAVALYRSTSAMMQESVYQKRLAQAQAIAEAGVEDALLQLRLNPAWRTGFSQKAFAGGNYTVTLSTDTSPWITSLGVSANVAIIGPARALVKTQAQLTSYGCTTLSNSNATANGFIDAYDSSVSTTPASFGFGGHFCSNNKFTVKDQGEISVYMDVNYFAGTAPDPTLIAGTVTKSTFTLTIPTHDGTAFINANNNNTLPAAFYTAATKDLTIPVNNTAVILPGIYYLDNLTVTGNLQVSNSTGTVTIYLNADFTLPNHANVHNGEITNLTGIPSRLLIYPQNAHTVSLQSKAAVYAILDGVASNLTIGTTFYGNLVGNTITLQNPNNFHFDIQTTNALPARSSWQLGSWTSSP